MCSVLAPIKNPRTTSQKKLSRQNLEDLQDHITSLPQPDSVFDWISLLTPTITDSDAVGSVAKKRKAPETLPSIAPSGGHKYSTSYAHTLYLLGISPLHAKGKVPSAPDHPEVSNLVLATSDLPSLSTFMTKRMLKFNPNEATFVIFLCRCLFLPKMSDEPDVMMLHEFSGPFKSHDLHELVRGDQAIKYPLVKRDPFKEEPDVLQTPAATDLRSRSDFVFAVSTNCFGQRFRHDIEMTARDFPIPGLSNDLRCCAVAIVAEAKPDSSPASVTAARNQWSSLAYLHMMERVSISREETYVGDEDICQYGYGICGLQVSVWKMGLQWNSSKGRKSEILEKYFTFPVQIVGRFNLEVQEHLEQFIEIHKAILRWWLGRYVTSYVRDVTNNLSRHPDQPEKWRTTWQEAVANFSPGEDLEIEEFDITTLGEDHVEDGHGNCQGFTKSNTRCRKKVKIGKYCLFHKKE